MTTERLEYLLQKCKLQLRKKRDTTARVWLEIALDEFPNSRELQRFAAKIYLQWGMKQKAIHFLDVEHIEDTSHDSIDGYDHDCVTQDDLFFIQTQLNHTEDLPFVFPSQNFESPTSTKKILTLKKEVISSKVIGGETDRVHLSSSGQKKVVVKHLKTKKICLSKELDHSETEIKTEDKSNIVPKEVCNPSYLPIIDEHQVVLEHKEDFEVQKESEHAAFCEEFNIEKEIIQNDILKSLDAEQGLSFQDISLLEDGSELAQEPTDLEFYQYDEDLLYFDEGDCEQFDVTDDAFISVFDEFDCDEDFEEIQENIDDVNDEYRSKLTRWERAQQVAVEVIYSTNWSGKHLPFLTDVFFESGWGAVRITMEKEILNGTTIDELILARDFKEIWKNCDRYWITLSKLGPFAHVTEATHRQMSWVQALRIIRCFNWLPSIEELEVFLEDEFEYWYQHTLMRRIFPVFMKYLCYYRAKNNPYMDFELGPYQSEFTDDPMDNGDFINCNSENRQRLSEVGLDAIKVHIH